jgi:hypothetical protein
MKNERNSQGSLNLKKKRKNIGEFGTLLKKFSACSTL